MLIDPEDDILSDEVDVTMGLSFTMPAKHFPTFLKEIVGALPRNVSVEIDVRESRVPVHGNGSRDA